MRNIIGFLFIFFGAITLFCTNAPIMVGIRDIVIGYLLLEKKVEKNNG